MIKSVNSINVNKLAPNISPISPPISPEREKIKKRKINVTLHGISSTNDIFFLNDYY